jgi:beta-galactosidase
MNDWTASPWYKLLNGTWKFNWSANPDSRPMNFYKDDFSVSGWKDIRVPSSIEVQGYGYPIYVNQDYEFSHLMKPTSNRMEWVMTRIKRWETSPNGSRRTWTVH